MAQSAIMAMVLDHLRHGGHIEQGTTAWAFLSFTRIVYTVNGFRYEDDIPHQTLSALKRKGLLRETTQETGPCCYVLRNDSAARGTLQP